MKDDRIRRSKSLRQDSTPNEKLIWHSIRSKQINNCKFRRQQEFGPYFLDFYCHELKLVIEIDGDVHALPDQIMHDKIRDKYLVDHGLTVLHINNNELPKNLNGVLQEIYFLTLTLSQRRGD